MPQLTAQTTEYTFSLSERKSMICRELNVPEAAVTVSYQQKDTSDYRIDRYPNYVVSNVKVTVDNTKIKK
jgi:hypothetical protein